MNKIPTIIVGCMNFCAGRFQSLIDSNRLEATAGVDLQVEDARRDVIPSLKGDVPEGLSNCLYTSLKEAKEKHPEAKVCLIYATSAVHARLIKESLSLGLHTLCVKPVALDRSEYLDILRTSQKHKDLLLVQGHNLRWTKSAIQVRKWLSDEDVFGEFIGGNIRFWIRQKLNGVEADSSREGMFQHCASIHQIDQITAALGLPKYATARYFKPENNPEIGQIGKWGTNGGHVLLEYENGACLTHTGTRAAHIELERYSWHGNFALHGSKADIIQDHERLQLFRKGECIEEIKLDPPISYEIIDEDRRQMDAFAEALEDEKTRAWLSDTTFSGSWILAEASNESDRTGEKIDVGAFKNKLLEEAI